jgi:hypothetical protein
MTVEISPEPTAAERAVLEALVAEPDDSADDGVRSAWRRAALEEAVGGEEPHGFESSL